MAAENKVVLLEKKVAELLNENLTLRHKLAQAGQSHLGPVKILKKTSKNMLMDVEEQQSNQSKDVHMKKVPSLEVKGTDPAGKELVSFMPNTNTKNESISSPGAINANLLNYFADLNAKPRLYYECSDSMDVKFKGKTENAPRSTRKRARVSSLQKISPKSIYVCYD